MFKNPVLFHQFGISWTVVKIGLVSGPILMVVAGVLFTALFKHVGAKTRKLTPSESQHLAFYAGQWGVVEYVHGKTWDGVAAELTWNIDTLRKAARRGDWFAFWVYPIMSSCWIIGLGLVLVSATIAARSPGGMASVIGFCSLMPRRREGKSPLTEEGEKPNGEGEKKPGAEGEKEEEGCGKPRVG